MLCPDKQLWALVDVVGGARDTHKKPSFFSWSCLLTSEDLVLTCWGQNWEDGPEETSVYALLGHNKASLSWTCPLLLGTSSKNQLADYLLSAVCTWQTLANGRPEGPGLSTNRRRRCSSHTQRNVSARSSLAPRSLAPRMDCLVRRVRGWKNSVRDGLSPQSRAGVTQVRSYIGNSWHPAWSTLLMLRNLSCNSVHCVLLHRLMRLPE